VATLFVSGAATLTNQSIVKLVESHFSDEFILQIVSSQPGSYDTSVDALLALKRAGVSDRVISALISRADSNVTASDDHLRDTMNSKAPKNPPSRVKRPQPILADGTPVRLRTLEILSSETASIGDQIDLQLVENLRTDDGMVIPRRTPAIGTITDVRKAGLAGRGGKLVLRADYLLLPSGERVPLRMSSGTSQFSLFGEDGDLVVASPTQWPTAAFVLKRGKEATLRRDTLLTVYIDDAPTVADGSVDR